MSQTFELIVDLVAKQDVRISEHGYDELAEDDILVGEIVAGVRDAVMVEDYPDYAKGPCVLVLQRDDRGQPVQVVPPRSRSRNERTSRARNTLAGRAFSASGRRSAGSRAYA